MLDKQNTSKKIREHYKNVEEKMDDATVAEFTENGKVIDEIRYSKKVKELQPKLNEVKGEIKAIQLQLKEDKKPYKDFQNKLDKIDRFTK